MMSQCVFSRSSPTASGSASVSLRRLDVRTPAMHLKVSASSSSCALPRRHTRRMFVKSMMSTNSSNPAFKFGKVSESISETRNTSRDLMTVDGAVQKTSILLAISMAGAASTWMQIYSSVPGAAASALASSQVAGFVALAAALATCFKPHWAPTTALIFAAGKGLALGGFSAVLEMRFPGIVLNALMLTFGVALTLLWGFQSGIIKVNEQMRSGIVMVTGGYFFSMAAVWLLSMVGVRLPGLFSGSPLAMGVTLMAAGLAAANLLLDFESIRAASFRRMPKWFEWYSGFSLMVTLIWMYTDILRLLAMFAGRRDD